MGPSLMDSCLHFFVTVCPSKVISCHINIFIISDKIFLPEVLYCKLLVSFIIPNKKNLVILDEMKWKKYRCIELVEL